MKQCAIVLNGNDVIKVSNLKRKYNKIISNPNMKILEECELSEIDDKYDYWNRTLNRDVEKELEEESKLYYFKNHKTGHTIVSIYPCIDNLKTCVKDWKDYERC